MKQGIGDFVSTGGSVDRNNEFKEMTLTTKEVPTLTTCFQHHQHFSLKANVPIGQFFILKHT